MKYYIIAGEASGDLHGANLIKGLLECDPEAEIRFWGGDKMVAAAGEKALVRHYKTTSFFGIVPVLMNLRTIFAQIGECKQDIAHFNPDVVILIDYPGFNMKIARFCHERGTKVFYYISPKVWAWKEHRVKDIQRYVDRLFIIFPFEKEYFQSKGIEAIYEGNPLVDSIEQSLATIPSREEFFENNELDERPIVALLAGSRKAEVSYNLPFMIELSRHFPHYQFVIGAVSWLDPAIYDKILAQSNIKLIYDQTFPLLRYAEAAVVASGTATLETALIGTPEVVCYRGDAVSAWVVRALIKVRFVSLVNLVMDREVVRELLQWDMSIPNAVAELGAILKGGQKREAMLQDYAELRSIIGKSGASKRFASRMIEELKTIKS